MNFKDLTNQIDFEKGEGLVPAIIQDVKTQKVLMLGYMNKESYEKTIETGKVTFYSRSKKRLWTKGEESGNFLELKDLSLDCDNDTLLIKVAPVGPVCHKGTDTCWAEENQASSIDFLLQLQQVITERKKNLSEKSYTASLFNKGINKIAQKVGEEAVELVIEAKDDNKDLFMGEAADLMFHYLVLLAAKDYKLEEVVSLLVERHSK
ncbi:bifunctional phosphoribosyl-AMP cyclohydrolase/phosphoribosyl-ATP diphosphatase HisIE [Labilibaculum euxinus]|uniref:Histidine biosynthesis bifunctional protein HisIE n=1 Tax=Labilibaculum euxinus TaxID=2686357 RepID=A0A7M4D8V3_9BACT|nr:bifunctional phosphoribosyl-AMP cyclohydrolase/phosphoribosyl-ATP diphosphatase HisIE [Labilibaculum euxinus]MUP39082.1 bifunctional phosphoribosyl-AMP cyclohydrolase/phosphoribosyl-ATP diphosphatase HisIE [Labilibaculum euxinus]MVB08287.1 bifunctional phosphoribosyl-AMP cyclohydrolase/phosphoribosyl-ATP diphosphatase HisIE [Labilibaculum euxinus]